MNDKRRGKIRFQLLTQRLTSFWSVYKKSKKGLLGIAIIVFFILMATIGPSLTPYDPIRDWYVSGSRVPPAWIKLFPGFGDLSENLAPISDPGFVKDTSVDEWTVSENSDVKAIVRSYESNEGNPLLSGPGSLLLSMDRNSLNSNINKTLITLSKTFNFPYEGPPDRFRCTIALKAENVEGVSINFTLILKDTNQNEYKLWEEKLSQDRDWFAPSYSIDTYSAHLKFDLFSSVLVNIPAEIFVGSGEYEYSLTIMFMNIDHDLNVNTNVYVDDLDIFLWGTCHGVLGTDEHGRDLFSQLMYGSRSSLLVGLLSAIFSVSIGLIVGLFAGYLGGSVDQILMRFADMLLVIPFLPFMLVLISVLGQSVWNVVLVITVLGWMSYSRWIRSTVLSLKERPFIEAARAAGASPTYIIIHHLLPNVMPLVYVALAQSVPSAITLESALSFLGLGDPSVMSWGRMLHDVVYYAAITELYWVIPPGICIALLGIAFVMMGYAIDEILNPRLRKR